MKKNVSWMELLMAVLIFGGQLAGCGSDSGYERYNNRISLNNLKQSVIEQLSETTESVTDWLQEHMENIRQSLLNGEYARVISELMEQWTQMQNDEYYNALLYIAYMGNGNETEAAALLENEQLNMETFVGAVEETAEELKENPDIQKIADDLVDILNGPKETPKPTEYTPPAATEPEETPEERPTQPRETEPPETVPEETVPEETVPEETVPEETECPPPPPVDRDRDEQEEEPTLPAVDKPNPTEATELCPPPPAVDRDRDNQDLGDDLSDGQ